MKISKYYKESLKTYPKLSAKQLQELYEIEKDAHCRFTGIYHELESAIGMLRIGHVVGWRVLLIIHNRRTIKKYEEILNINIKEFFPETGPGTKYSQGYKFFEKIGHFWKIVSGELSTEERKIKT